MNPKPSPYTRADALRFLSGRVASRTIEVAQHCGTSARTIRRYLYRLQADGMVISNQPDPFRPGAPIYWRVK